MTLATEAVSGLPDMKVSVRQLFGIDSDLQVPAYSEPDEHVPDVDPDYRFDRQLLHAFSNRPRSLLDRHACAQDPGIVQCVASNLCPAHEHLRDGAATRAPRQDEGPHLDAGQVLPAPP